LHPLIRLINKHEKIAIGLMSGTSMDGIDSALVKIAGAGPDSHVELVDFCSYPYPPRLGAELLKVSQPGNGSTDKICRLNRVVGEYFADAAMEICKQAQFNIAKVDFIGSHGQTICHVPEKILYFDKPANSTLQIGEPAVIASRTGCITVSNFRTADMARGGEGAPLVPYFDYLMFQSEQRNRVILNIGGIANITVLKKGGTINDVIAFDTGPGNMVINALMRKLYHQDFDENGAVALAGNVSEQLLTRLLQHPFFARRPPRSTGRKDFGHLFVDQIMMGADELQLTSPDIIATATALTARSIADAMQYSSISIEEVDELIVSGGGFHNQALLQLLRSNFCNSTIVGTEAFNIPGDAKEAICFAVLANDALAGKATSLPSVTGATQPAILGAIYYG